MLLSWLLGPGALGSAGCCARSPKNLSCLRGKDGEGEGNIVEYSPHGQTQLSSAELVVDGSFGRGMLPMGPMIRTVPTYATGQDAGSCTALQGRPLYTADVLRLSLGDCIHESVMSLHVNGFLISPRGDAGIGQGQPLPQPICRLWSPFSLVEKCQVKSKQNDSQWSIFKLTFFRKEGQDSSFYFATAGENADEERNKWVDEIIQVLSNLTLSLFPNFELSVDPVPGRVATSTRIMAGYLLQGGMNDRASLVFCELHAYLGKEARLALYKDQWCEQEVLSMSISDSSIVSTRKGAYCTVFGINDQLFCTRTEDERELWLRAVSNIKVKLMFDAPDPTAEELEVFRSAVSERIESLPPPLPPGGKEAMAAFAAAAIDGAATECRGSSSSSTVASMIRSSAVLSEVPRRPPAGPMGDAFDDPEPIAEEEFPEITRPWGARPSLMARASKFAGVVEEPSTPSSGDEEVPEAIPVTKEPAKKLPYLSALSAAPAAGGIAMLSIDASTGAAVEGL